LAAWRQAVLDPDLPPPLAAGRHQAALRAPTVTARGLARQLGITPQGTVQGGCNFSTYY
jgi:hypothetical protein